MKRILLMMIVGLFSSITYAQNSDTLKVHQGTYIRSFLLSNVDSITHDGGQFVSIYHDEQMSAYSVNNVDSIVIKQATGICYQIPEEQLNGWDDGVYYTDKNNEDNSLYILSQNELEEGYTIVCLNCTENKDNNNALKLVFGPNSEIQDVFIGNYQFEAHPNNEEIIFFVYDQERYAIGLFSVPYADEEDLLLARGVSAKRAGAHLRSPNIRSLIRGINLYQNYDFLNNLAQGRYGNILEDFLLGRLVGLGGLPFLVEFMSAEALKLFIQQLYENNKNWFLGSAGIEITSIKRASRSSISVEGEISNISTIPSTRLVASEYPNYIGDKLVYMKEVPNYVLYGVAEGKSGQPGLYLHDKCTTPAVVSGSHFSCSLPVEYKPGQTFYFRPFLVPASQFEESADFGQAVGKMIASNVRYGNRKEFTDQTPTCSTGDVVSKTDKSAVVKCSYSGAEGFECGVMVSSDNGTKPFPANSEDGEHQINLSGLTPATTYNYWAYVNVDGIPTNGAVKSFTTNPPDISGTWNCTEKNSNGETIATWIFNLNSDGSGSATEGANSYNEVSWNIGSGGNVGIHVTLYATSHAWGVKEFWGTVDNIYNPSKIEGDARRSNGTEMGGYGEFWSTFVMTR